MMLLDAAGVGPEAAGKWSRLWPTSAPPRFPDRHSSPENSLSYRFSPQSKRFELAFSRGRYTGDLADRHRSRTGIIGKMSVTTPHVGVVTYKSQAKAFIFFAGKLKRAWQVIGNGN